MKKYILNDEYKKFRVRVTACLSVLMFILVLILVSLVSPDSMEDAVPVVAGILSGISVWIAYFALRWIYKSLPK